MPTILITGGHGGIGLACSQYLAEHYSANLLLAGRSLARLEPVALELARTHGVKVSTLELDTSSLASVRAAAARCHALLDDGTVDSLQAIRALRNHVARTTARPGLRLLATIAAFGVLRRSRPCPVLDTDALHVLAINSSIRA